jgi:hypothetical protein
MKVQFGFNKVMIHLVMQKGIIQNKDEEEIKWTGKGVTKTKNPPSPWKSSMEVRPILKLMNLLARTQTSTCH